MDQEVARKADPIMFATVLYITFISAVVRLILPASSVAPLNDGGLFYSMTVDLQRNGYLLPTYTTYNLAHIPFAYPPLAFYVTGILSSVFHWSVFDLIRLLPPLISALAIPAFYLLAKEILESKAQVALAVLIFAFIPRTLDWLVMGGGITRSFGLVFALLSIRQLYLLFSTHKTRHVIFSILFAALTIYTHPEATVHTIISALTFYLLKDRTLKGMGRALIVGCGALALTAPWWLTVLSRHGISTLIAPMTAVGQDSPGLLGRILALLRFQFTDETLLSVVAILGLLGLAALLIRKQYFLPIWLFLLFMIEPRGGSLYIMIPHAMMAAVGVEMLVLPGLKNLPLRSGQASATKREGWIYALLDGTTAKLLLGFILFYGAISAFVVIFTVNQKYTLKARDVETFEWVKENTPTDSQFVLLTGENVLRDASSEWFPALTGRRSLATIFGYEWVNDGLFGQRREEYASLQDCINQDVTCLDNWSKRTGQMIDYVYIKKYVEERPAKAALIQYLSLSNEYEQTYESDGAVIFHHVVH